MCIKKSTALLNKVTCFSCRFSSREITQLSLFFRSRSLRNFILKVQASHFRFCVSLSSASFFDLARKESRSFCRNCVFTSSSFCTCCRSRIVALHSLTSISPSRSRSFCNCCQTINYYQYHRSGKKY